MKLTVFLQYGTATFTVQSPAEAMNKMAAMRRDGFVINGYEIETK